MKVGILTMYYRRNYGGVLQLYALSQVIKQFGNDVEIIDFRYNARENQTFEQLLKIAWGKISNIMGIKPRLAKNPLNTRKLPVEHVKAIESFKKTHLHFSKEVSNSTIGDIAGNYDAIIVGSDQVWNDIKGKHLFYFFDFGKPYFGKKISYAPCSIETHVTKRCLNKLKKYLSRFDALSVRDTTTQRLVYLSTGITPPIVLDPTLLYGFEEFKTPALVCGDYVFAYILGSEIDGGHHRVLNKIFEKYGKMKIVAAILPDISLEVEKFADEIKYNATPDEWVSLIANARFIYTDSFHGCVFSMKFHKPFYAYYKDASRTSRLIDLKEQFRLSSIHASSDECLLTVENYTQIDEKINVMKDYSLDFLSRSLS